MQLEIWHYYLTFSHAIVTEIHESLYSFGSLCKCRLRIIVPFLWKEGIGAVGEVDGESILVYFGSMPI